MTIDPITFDLERSWSGKVDVDGFDVGVVGQSVFSKFSSDTRGFVSTCRVRFKSIRERRKCQWCSR